MARGALHDYYFWIMHLFKSLKTPNQNLKYTCVLYQVNYAEGKQIQTDSTFPLICGACGENKKQ